MRALDPRLISRVKAIRTMLIANGGLGLLSALLVLAQAVLLAHVAASGFAGEPLSALIGPIVALCAVIGLRALTGWAFEVVGRRAAADVLSRLRLDLVGRQVSEPGSARAEAAEVAATAVNGIDALEATFARYMPQVFLAVAVPIAVLILVGAIDPLSMAIMLLTLPLVPVFMWLVGRYTERRARERLRALNLLAGHFLDVVRGLPTLRAFNRGKVQAERIAEVSDEYRKTTMGTLRVAFLSGAVLEFAATLGVALVAVTVGVRLVEGGIGFEAALTVLVLAPELYVPLRQLGVHYHASADGRAVAGRLLDLGERRDTPTTEAVGQGADHPIDPDADPSPRRLPIRMRDVHFAYPDRDVVVLDSISLELHPGECLALVGPSGIGKSTVAELLIGIERPLSGRITVGEIDLASCDAERWRARLAWAPQSPTMFRGSIADNIRLGDPDADHGRVNACASLAGLDGLLERLGDGIETTIGEGARVLSAGERQRVALARSFLRDADLLILDEPTANLDPVNAARIGDAIIAAGKDRTVLLITHDLELAARADRIVELSPADRRALEAGEVPGR